MLQKLDADSQCCILAFLPCTEMARFRQVCKHVYENVCNKEQYWKNLYSHFLLQEHQFMVQQKIIANNVEHPECAKKRKRLEKIIDKAKKGKRKVFVKSSKEAFFRYVHATRASTILYEMRRFELDFPFGKLLALLQMPFCHDKKTQVVHEIAQYVNVKPVRQMNGAERIQVSAQVAKLVALVSQYCPALLSFMFLYALKNLNHDAVTCAYAALQQHGMIVPKFCIANYMINTWGPTKESVQFLQKEKAWSLDEAEISRQFQTKCHHVTYSLSLFQYWHETLCIPLLPDYLLHLFAAYRRPSIPVADVEWYFDHLATHTCANAPVKKENGSVTLLRWITRFALGTTTMAYFRAYVKHTKKMTYANLYVYTAIIHYSTSFYVNNINMHFFQTLEALQVLEQDANFDPAWLQSFMHFFCNTSTRFPIAHHIIDRYPTALLDHTTPLYYFVFSEYATASPQYDAVLALVRKLLQHKVPIGDTIKLQQHIQKNVKSAKHQQALVLLFAQFGVNLFAKK